MIGSINLKNGLQMKEVNVKKDFEIMNQYFHDSPNDFGSLRFLEQGDLKTTIANFKVQSKSNYKYFKILEDKNIIGFVESSFFRESSLLTIMLSPNYSGAKSLASVVVHFKNKIKNSLSSIITLSLNDLLTINLLNDAGITSNILYVVGQELFQFIGNDIENAASEDWEDVSSQLSFDQFFNINYINQAEAQNTSVVENNLENGDFQEETNADETIEGESLDDDVIEFDDNEEVVLPTSLNEESPQFDFASEEQILMSQADNNSIEGVFDDRNTHQMIGHDPYGNPVYYIPETGVKYIGQPNADGGLDVKNALSKKDFEPSNISKYIATISKLPTNVSYSKVNPELFVTITNTPTFKSFKDTTVNENRLARTRKFAAPSWKNNDTDMSKNQDFRARMEAGLSNWDSSNSKLKNTSFQDMINARKNQFKSNNKTSSNEKSSFGFGNKVISL